MHNMGSHLAFVGMCKHTAGQLMAKTWTAHGKPKGFWQQALFLACRMLASGNGETIPGSTSLAGASHSHGFTGNDKLVKVGVCPPCGYHPINLGPILLVVVVDQAVGIALP